MKIDLELANKAAERLLKGDVPGHEFHGNQYSDGGGESDHSIGPRDVQRAVDSGNSAKAYAAAMDASRRAGSVGRGKDFAVAHDSALLANQVVRDAHKEGKIQLTAKQSSDIRANIRDHEGMLRAGDKR